MNLEPITLGQKLATSRPGKQPFEYRSLLRNTLYALLSISLLTVIFTLLLWWLLVRPDLDKASTWGLLATLFALWIFVYRRRPAPQPRKDTPLPPLLANDRQGFMQDLRLDTKTAIFDGSNIYHFGHDNGLGKL
ncbi:MAG: hypothetical protein Q9M48_08520 [Rhodobacterales bacterium]|nr:hypothetical protein [Rhodobacterales bacterium]